jgi:hypothetical protein
MSLLKSFHQPAIPSLKRRLDEFLALDETILKIFNRSEHNVVYFCEQIEDEEEYWPSYRRSTLDADNIVITKKLSCPDSLSFNISRCTLDSEEKIVASFLNNKLIDYSISIDPKLSPKKSLRSLVPNGYIDSRDWFLTSFPLNISVPFKAGDLVDYLKSPNWTVPCVMESAPNSVRMISPSGEPDIGADFSDLVFQIYFLKAGEVCWDDYYPFINFRYHTGELKGKNEILTHLEALLKGHITLEDFLHLKKVIEARAEVEREQDCDTQYYFHRLAEEKFKGQDNCLLQSESEKLLGENR